MRLSHAFAAAALASLAACGSSSSSSSSGSPVSGTVGGKAFTLTEARAVRASTADGTSCTLPVIGAASISAMALDLATYTGVCGDYSSANCVLHGGTEKVTVILAKLTPSGTVAPTLSAKTYTVSSSLAGALPDGQGNFLVVYAQALATGAAPGCAGTPSPAVDGGTLVINALSATSVSGHLDVTFQDGSSAKGDFTADVCGSASPDICGLATTEQLCSPTPTTCM